MLKPNLKQRKLGSSKMVSTLSSITQRESSTSLFKASNVQTPRGNKDKNVRISEKFERSDDLEYLQLLTKKILHLEGQNKVCDNFPSLTSSNELDVHLYALFALLLENFVFKWYDDRNGLGLLSKKEFTEELVFLFAHVCRNLNERIRNNKDEMIRTIVLDVPYVLNSHFESLKEIEHILLGDSSLKIDSIFVEKWINVYGDGLDDEQTNLNYRRMLVDTIVHLLFPSETTRSIIAREFLVSLMNDLLVKNILDSFCDNFVLWEIIGKICHKLNQRNNSDEIQKEKLESHVDKGQKRWIFNLLLGSFAIEDNRTMETHSLFSYADFYPMLCFLFNITSFNLIITTTFQAVLQFLLNISFLQRFISRLINHIFSRNLFSSSNMVPLVDFLRHMLFPTDEFFEMKPRFIPSNDDELKEIYDLNLKHLTLFLKNNNFLGCFSGDAETQAKNVLNAFQHKPINRLLLQKLLDVIVAPVFPELHNEG